MTIAQLKNETPVEDIQHKTNVIFPFRTWMCLTPGKLASFDNLGKAKVNKFETTQIHFSLTFTLLSSKWLLKLSNYSISTLKLLQIVFG